MIKGTLFSNMCLEWSPWHPVWSIKINSSLVHRATPASSPIWTGPETVSTSSPTQETTRSSSVGPPSCLSSHTCTAYPFFSMDNKEFNPFRFVFPGEASSGKHVTNMDVVRNLEWATSTCTLGFNTFGRLRKLTFFPSGIYWYEPCEPTWDQQTNSSRTEGHTDWIITPVQTHPTKILLSRPNLRRMTLITSLSQQPTTRADDRE